MHWRCSAAARGGSDPGPDTVCSSMRASAWVSRCSAGAARDASASTCTPSVRCPPKPRMTASRYGLADGPRPSRCRSYSSVAAASHRPSSASVSAARVSASASSRRARSPVPGSAVPNVATVDWTGSLPHRASAAQSDWSDPADVGPARSVNRPARYQHSGRIRTRHGSSPGRASSAHAAASHRPCRIRSAARLLAARIGTGPDPSPARSASARSARSASPSGSHDSAYANRTARSSGSSDRIRRSRATARSGAPSRASSNARYRAGRRSSAAAL